jgi:2-polyprenyl-3-methyl-5-hydroxy-6-metoxy-1,4-benzoquinol methylase
VWTAILESIDPKGLYSDEVYQVVDNRGSIFEKIILKEAAAVLVRAKSLIDTGGKRLLDFGCGKGQFLKQAKAMGWSAVGVETSPERADFARYHYGIEVYGELYTRGPIASGSFDFIALNHVLEHLPEPIALLGELLESNLTPGGVAMIEVPRLDSWQSRVAGGHWMHLDIPKHLSHWTEKRLRVALDGLGYKVVARRRFSFHLGVLGMLQALGSRVGYKDNIIVGLKRRRPIGLLLFVACLTPLALALEVLGTLCNRSGIIGLFVQKRRS